MLEGGYILRNEEAIYGLLIVKPREDFCVEAAGETARIISERPARKAVPACEVIVKGPQVKRMVLEGPRGNASTTRAAREDFAVYVVAGIGWVVCSVAREGGVATVEERTGSEVFSV